MHDQLNQESNYTEIIDFLTYSNSNIPQDKTDNYVPEDNDVSTNVETFDVNDNSLHTILLTRKDKKKAQQKKRKLLLKEEQGKAQQQESAHGEVDKDPRRVKLHPPECFEVEQLDHKVDSKPTGLLEEIKSLKQELDTLNKKVTDLELKNAKKDSTISNLSKKNTALALTVKEQREQIDRMKEGFAEEGYVYSDTEDDNSNGIQEDEEGHFF